LLQVAAADREQRADDFAGEFAIVVFDRNARVNTAKASNAGAADQAHEDGFGLIVKRVAGGDLVEDWARLT
jgi:hypothetical protein